MQWTPTISYNNNLFGNNVPALDGVDGNVVSVPTNTDVFVGYATQGDYSTDGRFQLLPSSPAIGAADDGSDCGAFENNLNTYVLSGIPNRAPVIYNVVAPLQGTVQDGINVTIKARSVE